MENNDTDDLIIYIRWFDFLEWLLPITGNFQPVARQSIGVRLDNTALDIAEAIAQARYAQYKAVPQTMTEMLTAIYPTIERFRLLGRLGFRLKYFSSDQYRFVALTIDETTKLHDSWVRKWSPGSSS